VAPNNYDWMLFLTLPIAIGLEPLTSCFIIQLKLYKCYFLLLGVIDSSCNYLKINMKFFIDVFKILHYFLFFY